MPLHRILSLSQDRILGATARVFVQCLGMPRELCEAHIRMTMKYGDTEKKMLIPIWVLKLYYYIKQFAIVMHTEVNFQILQNCLETSFSVTFTALCYHKCCRSF